MDSIQLFQRRYQGWRRRKSWGRRQTAKCGAKRQARALSQDHATTVCIKSDCHASNAIFALEFKKFPARRIFPCSRDRGTKEARKFKWTKNDFGESTRRNLSY